MSAEPASSDLGIFVLNTAKRDLQAWPEASHAIHTLRTSAEAAAGWYRDSRSVEGVDCPEGGYDRSQHCCRRPAIVPCGCDWTWRLRMILHHVEEAQTTHSAYFAQLIAFATVAENADFCAAANLLGLTPSVLPSQAAAFEQPPFLAVPESAWESLPKQIWQVVSSKVDVATRSSSCVHRSSRDTLLRAPSSP
jgi:hypothetical protein